jgi:hypothetical protein
MKKDTTPRKVLNNENAHEEVQDQDGNNRLGKMSRKRKEQRGKKLRRRSGKERCLRKRKK